MIKVLCQPTIERVYLLQQQDLDGLVRLRALLEADQHGIHQLLPIGRQDGHVVTWLVMELVGATGAQYNLLCPPAAASNGERVRGERCDVRGSEVVKVWQGGWVRLEL